jgi:hypothetical protein
MSNTANTLTGLIPTIYQGLDIVSRELVGFIPSVSRNASEQMASLDQVIRVPVTPVGVAGNVTPNNVTPESAGVTIGYTDMAITKARMVPVHWNGEEQMGISQNGQYNKILADQFAQAMRTLSAEIEADLANLYKGASRAVGAGGTNPFASTIGNTALLHKVLADNGAPLGNKRLVIDTTAGAQLRTLTHLTKANEAGSDATLRNGVLLDLNGFQIRESAQIKSHTKGTGTGDTLSGTPAIGATLLTFSAFTAGEYVAGDVISIADDANKYVVTSADADNNQVTIAQPGLRKTGINGKAITVEDYTANMAFDSNALILLARAPAVPVQGDMAFDRITVSDPVSGLPFQISMYKQYRQVFYEVAIAWGVKLVKPAHTALLLG